MQRSSNSIRAIIRLGLGFVVCVRITRKHCKNASVVSKTRQIHIKLVLTRPLGNTSRCPSRSTPGTHFASCWDVQGQDTEDPTEKCFGVVDVRVLLDVSFQEILHGRKMTHSHCVCDVCTKMLMTASNLKFVCLFVQRCRFSVIFGFFRYFWPDPFSIFSYFIFLFLNFQSLFVFIFCETARTGRFSVIFAKVQWHPCVLVAERPSNMLVYLRDGSALTILCAATLR